LKGRTLVRKEVGCVITIASLHIHRAGCAREIIASFFKQLGTSVSGENTMNSGIWIVKKQESLVVTLEKEFEYG
jgi:hypothetical protein